MPVITDDSVFFKTTLATLPSGNGSQAQSNLANTQPVLDKPIPEWQQFFLCFFSILTLTIVCGGGYEAFKRVYGPIKRPNFLKTIAVEEETGPPHAKKAHSTKMTDPSSHELKSVENIKEGHTSLSENNSTNQKLNGRLPNDIVITAIQNLAEKPCSSASLLKNSPKFLSKKKANLPSNLPNLKLDGSQPLHIEGDEALALIDDEKTPLEANIKFFNSLTTSDISLPSLDSNRGNNLAISNPIKIFSMGIKMESEETI